MTLSTRYTWEIKFKGKNGWRIELTCNEKGKVLQEGELLDNPRSPAAGTKTTFQLDNPDIRRVGIQGLMESLTDDQCDSFFPQAPVKKSKKAK